MPTDSFAPVTPQGGAIAWLFTLAMVLSALVLLGVVAVLGYSLIRYRDRGDAAPASTTEGHPRLEVAWTVAPALLLAVLFGLTVQTMRRVEAEPPAGPALRVQVIGHQWWWEYRYPDLGVVTANELHLPTGRPVTLELTGADVIHSFWVPRFGWKVDTVPNRQNRMVVTVDQAGDYDGACTEYCGTQHAWMRIRVVAEPPADFDAWAARQQADAAAPADATADRGRQLFQTQTCVSCHTVRGVSTAAAVGPDLTHVGDRATLGAGVLANTPDNLRRWLHDAQGAKPGVLMPAYNLSDDDLAALAAYLAGLH